ncbi:MAG: hypothetical protein GQ570_03965 [Helicobacteraceae bacterium]|nr:hypothetical protein [Helicobacteraceae bacterium]
MADIIYNQFYERMGDGTFDFDNHTFKAMLLTDAHTPTAADAIYTNVNTEEVAAGNGYTSGGKALTGVTWATSGAIATFDCADIIWTGATITARYCIIYDDTAASKNLLLLLDFGQNTTSSLSDFTISIDALGLFRVAAKGAI